MVKFERRMCSLYVVVVLVVVVVDKEVEREREIVTYDA